MNQVVTPHTIQMNPSQIKMSKVGLSPPKMDNMAAQPQATIVV